MSHRLPPPHRVRRHLALLAAALATLFTSGCAQLLQEAQFLQRQYGAQTAAIKPLLPTVTYQDAVMTESPSKAMMAAYFCPIVVPNPGPIPGVAALACRQVFGPPPSPSQMRVSFDLRFKVKNPNRFPIPVAELLTAATVFPAQTNQSLGAACIAFCGADQPGCNGQPRPGACVSRSTDIRSVDDFKQAAVGFLISTGVSALTGGKPSFVMPQVVQDAEVLVTARFSFGPDALLLVLQQLAKQAVKQLQTGQQVEFIIPYRLEGTVWLDVGSLGRVAVGFGPAQGTWTIPTNQLIRQ